MPAVDGMEGRREVIMGGGRRVLLVMRGRMRSRMGRVLGLLMTRVLSELVRMQARGVRVLQVWLR